jgi:hypothetical protein
MMLSATLQLEPAGASLGLHSTIAGSLFVITGYQIASMGVFATAASDPIRAPSDPVTTWILDRFNLEQGATLGTLVFASGTVYACSLLYQWATNGFSSLSFTLASLLAFTAIVVGLQMIFSAFFLGLVNRC